MTCHWTVFYLYCFLYFFDIEKKTQQLIQSHNVYVLYVRVSIVSPESRWVYRCLSLCDRGCFRLGRLTKCACHILGDIYSTDHHWQITYAIKQVHIFCKYSPGSKFLATLCRNKLRLTSVFSIFLKTVISFKISE